MLAAALRTHRQLHASVIAACTLLFVAAGNISPTRGKPVTLQDVYDLAQRITAKYGAAGYVLSRAIVPVQELDRSGGSFAYRVQK
jgi:hemolysin activation/secretion protein